jgi:site-specific recombinase XerD
LRTIRNATPTAGVAWLTEFLASLTKADLSPKTVMGYRQDLELFRRWFESLRGPEARLETLSTIDLISYRQHLVTVERRKPATINRRLQALRRLCRWAKSRGILDPDPSVEVKTVRVSAPRRPLGLNQSEVHALLRTAGESGHAKRNYALIQSLLQTGLRISEVVSLCIADVTVRARTGAVRVRQGKGRKEREVPLNATARRALGAYLGTREGIKPDTPLFESGRGARLSVRSIQHTITHLARRAKITRIRVSPHTLRHTFAMHYLRQNPGKVVELANLLGHDSLDSTAIYTQPSREDLANDLEKSPLNVYG